MRVVSVNGNVDILYDNLVLIIEEGHVLGRVIGADFDFVLANYSSEEKARKAVSRMRASYQMMNVSVFKFPKESDL